VVDMPSADIDAVAFALRAGLCEAIVRQASAPSAVPVAGGAMHPLHSSSRGGVLDESYKRPLLRVERRGGLQGVPCDGACLAEVSDAEASRSVVSSSVREWHCKGARHQCGDGGGTGRGFRCLTRASARPALEGVVTFTGGRRGWGMRRTCWASGRCRSTTRGPTSAPSPLLTRASTRRVYCTLSRCQARPPHAPRPYRRPTWGRCVRSAGGACWLR
jgi:hypothetical protein